MGDILAYRTFELNPAKQPWQSSWRLGALKSVRGAAEVTLVPWPDAHAHPMQTDWRRFCEQVSRDGQARATGPVPSIPAL